MLNKTNSVIVEAFKRGYQIDPAEGKIFSPRGKELSKMLGRNGYFCVCIFVPGVTRGKGMTVSFHRLLAYHLFGKKLFTPGLEVRHLDGNRLNNSPENIKLGTRLENIMDMTHQQRSDRSRGIKRENHA